MIPSPKTFINTSLFVFLLIAGGLSAFVYLHLPAIAPFLEASKTSIDDASSLNSTPIERIVTVHTEEDISKAIRIADEQGLKVTIAGKRHSMGGQTFYKGAVVIDMTTFNKIKDFDPNAKLLTVESGTTWSDIQSYLNPNGYAVVAMQGPNIFTVGGSISVNAHGWDVILPSVADTVEWFRIILADGTVKRCSAKENFELYHLVLGGYGLFGIILDVGLRVTENHKLTPHYTTLSYRDLPSHFENTGLTNNKIELTYGDFSIAPDSLLDEVVVSEFERADDSDLSQVVELSDEEYILRDRFFLNLSRKYDWGKSLRWYLYKQLQLPETEITRNNLMRSPFKRLLYYSPSNVDILQEYFIPRSRSVEFIDRLRSIIKAHRSNLLNCTIRVIKSSTATFLNYAKHDSFAFVLYFNVEKDKAGQENDRAMTNELISAALEYGGTFYLPYLPYFNFSQLKTAYPEIDEFFQAKRRYDPEELFTNYFYEKYAKGIEWK